MEDFENRETEKEESQNEIVQNNNTEIVSSDTAVKKQTNYSGQINKINLQHLAIVLSKLSFFCFGVLLFLTIGQLFLYLAVGIFVMTIFVIWLFLTLVTLGVIYIVIPGFSHLLDIAKDSSEHLTKISAFFNAIGRFSPIILAIALGGGIASIILLSKTAPGKHRARKVTLIVFMSLSAIFTIWILIALGGVK